MQNLLKHHPLHTIFCFLHIHSSPLALSYYLLCQISLQRPDAAMFLQQRKSQGLGAMLQGSSAAAATHASSPVDHDGAPDSRHAPPQAGLRRPEPCTPLPWALQCNPSAVRNKAGGRAKKNPLTALGLPLSLPKPSNPRIFTPRRLLLSFAAPSHLSPLSIPLCGSVPPASSVT